MFDYKEAILVGLNQDPSKIYVDFYDPKVLCNSNAAILGYAGEGKSCITQDSAYAYQQGPETAPGPSFYSLAQMLRSYPCRSPYDNQSAGT